MARCFDRTCFLWFLVIALRLRENGSEFAPTSPRDGAQKHAASDGITATVGVSLPFPNAGHRQYHVEGCADVSCAGVLTSNHTHLRPSPPPRRVQHDWVAKTTAAFPKRWQDVDPSSVLQRWISSVFPKASQPPKHPVTPTPSSSRRPWDTLPASTPSPVTEASEEQHLIPITRDMRCLPGAIYRACVSLCFEKADAKSTSSWWSAVEPDGVLLYEGESGGTLRTSDVRTLSMCLRDCRGEYIDNPTPGCVTAHGYVIPGAPTDDPETGIPVYNDGIRLPGSLSYHIHRELHRIFGDHVFQHTLILIVWMAILSAVLGLSVRFSDTLLSLNAGASSDEQQNPVLATLTRVLVVVQAYSNQAMSWIRKDRDTHLTTHDPPPLEEIQTSLLGTDEDEEQLTSHTTVVDEATPRGFPH